MSHIISKAVLQIECEEDSSISKEVNPSNEYGWKVYSFNDRHYNYRDPDTVMSVKYESHGPGFLSVDVYGVDVGIRRKLDVGTAFWLDRFEHGNCVWSLHGSGPQCRFDTSRYGGIMIWEGDLKNLPAKTFEKRAEHAKKLLSAYTSWCNGEVYFLQLTYFLETPQGPEECTESMTGVLGYESIPEYVRTLLSECGIGRQTPLKIGGDAACFVEGEDLFAVEEGSVEV